jgi:hypothetical protein
MYITIHRAPQSMLCTDNMTCPTQYWKENMPDAIESGRVRLQGLFYFRLYPPGVGTTDMIGFPRPRLLHAPTCTAGGRLRLSRLQNTARLVRRVLPHPTETFACCCRTKDSACLGRAGFCHRLRRTCHTRDPGSGGSHPPQAATPQHGPSRLIGVSYRHAGKKVKRNSK